MVRKQQQRNAMRRYLLNQLSSSEREAVELKLLKDDIFSEEFEIVEDELIDEYLTNELTQDERSRFEKVFLAHPERQRKLKAGQAFKRHFDSLPSPSPPAGGGFQYLRNLISTPFSLPAIRTAVVIASVVVIGILVWRAVFWQSDLQKGLQALNEAYKQERPVEARVSNLDHAPFITTRNGTEPEGVNTIQRSRAERLLLDAYTDRPNAESSHELGKFYLYQRQLDRAIELLEQARKADGNNAQVYADLGAAYLEKGKLELDKRSAVSDFANGKRVEDLSRSLEYLKQALELNPNLLEALFNRALVHQYQGLNQQAEADWRSYLEKDPYSAWATEAQQKLKRLEEKKLSSQNTDDSLEAFLQAYRARDDERVWELYRRRHGTAGNEITKTLVDRILSDTDAVSENLQALNYLGQLENRKTQDLYTSDLAKVYSAATPRRYSLLAQARQQMDEGYKLFRKSQVGGASELFTSARRIFESAGDLPESLAAEVAIAHAAAVKPDSPKGNEILSRLIPSSEARQYKWLLAQCFTKQAHIDSNLSNYSKAISDADRALELFRELEDVNNTLGGLLQLAGFHLSLNDNDRSLSYLQQALVTGHNQPLLPTDLWGIHIAISLNLSALKLYRAALDYQNEALHIALQLGTPIFISRSYQYIGLTLGSLRQFELALQNLRQAYEQGKSLSNERNGLSMMANASLKLGDLYRAVGDPKSALAAYDESLQLYDALRFAHYSYAAHKGKLLSYLVLQNDAMASQELETVLSLFDEYRGKILSERQNVFFFDREQDTYDLAIDFAYTRLSDPRRAFDYSEISRARNLRELMYRGAELTRSSSGLDLRSARNSKAPIVSSLNSIEIQQRIPERVQLVQYALLEKKLLVWTITRSHFYPTVVEIEAEKLKQLITTTLRQISGRDDNALASLKELYNLLVEPIRKQLDSNSVLCIVPDKALHYVPFGALISGGSGRFLSQDLQIMVSPSATILVELSEDAHHRPPLQVEHLLAVANPSVDRTSNPNLPNLPEAEREVERLASNYISPRVLSKGDATRQSVIDELPRADVAHFAAHYEIDPRSSLLSRLVLGPGPGKHAPAQSSGLSSSDIYGLKLSRTRLVVLSACNTGIEQQFAGEGSVGFARSFLVARVPVVVASLWPVDSDATSELMIAFHRVRKEKVSSTAALMRAQQEMMNRGNYRHPYYWAGFTIVGGYADF